MSVTVDATELLKNLENRVKMVKDFSAVLLKIRGEASSTDNTIIGGINQAFVTQGASLGKTWADLTHPYADNKAKEYPGKTILIRRGDLYNSLVNFQDSESAKTVNILTATTLDYGTTSRIGGWLQAGTSKMIARPFMKIMPNQLASWKKLISQQIVEVGHG